MENRRSSQAGVGFRRALRASAFLAAFLLGLSAFAGVGSPDCGAVFKAGPVPVLGPAEIQPRLIVFSAPSGGGKTTLAQLLVKEFPNLAISVSSTTRAPRGKERNGVDYHFMSVEEFKAKIARGKFAEWAEVHGNYYGTDVETIQDEFTKGHSVLALVDVKGAENLRRSFAGRVYSIFISPPDMATLEQRLRARGTDSEESIRKRLENAKREMAEAPRFDQVVVNDDLERAKKELSELIRARGLVPVATP